MRVLYVEDNGPQVRLTKAAVERTGLPIDISVASTAQDAADAVFRRGRWADEPTPDVVLLDLGLPGGDGRDVLAQLKRTPAIRRVPVIVLSHSHAPDDVTSCYDLHANAYFRKPIVFSEFVRLVEVLFDFWATAALATPEPTGAGVTDLDPPLDVAHSVAGVEVVASVR